MASSKNTFPNREENQSWHELEKPNQAQKDQAPDEQFRSPEEWAMELKTPSHMLAAADTLHGWKVHRHHEAQPIRLSRAAFEAALRVLDDPIADEAGVFSIKPCKEATSPHLGKGI